MELRTCASSRPRMGGAYEGELKPTVAIIKTLRVADPRDPSRRLGLQNRDHSGPAMPPGGQESASATPPPTRRPHPAPGDSAAARRLRSPTPRRLSRRME